MCHPGYPISSKKGDSHLRAWSSNLDWVNQRTKSVETHPEGFVHVSIRQSGNSFSFVAENTVAPNVKPFNGNVGVAKKSGIGQKNVQQRLILHYGESYDFDIKQENGTYTVKIEL